MSNEYESLSSQQQELYNAAIGPAQEGFGYGGLVGAEEVVGMVTGQNRFNNPGIELAINDARRFSEDLKRLSEDRSSIEESISLVINTSKLE